MGKFRAWLKSSDCLFCLCSVVFLGLGTYYALAHQAENEYLKREVLAGLLSGAETPRQKLEKITSYVHSRRDFETTERSHYLNPLFYVVKAPPRQVNELGGQCGNLVRLAIALLDLSGVEARKVHLYNERSIQGPKKTAYVHAVVEARIEDRWAVTDPTLGLNFRRTDGSPATVEDLSDVSFLSSQVDGHYDFDLLTYGEVRRVRWDKFAAGETLYRIIMKVFGKSFADQVSYPYCAERPYLFFAFVFPLLALCSAAICWRRRRGARGSENGPSASGNQSGSRDIHRIRVLMVIDSLGYGGAEKQFCEVVNRIDRRRFEIHVCLTASDLSGTGRLDREKLGGVYAFGRGRGPGPWLMLRRSWKLARVIREVSPDVVHAWLWYSCVLSAAARGLWRAKTKVILALHCSLDWFESQGTGGKVRARMAVTANRLCDLVLTLSAGMKRELVDQWGHAEKMIQVAPNGVDLSEADRTRSDPNLRRTCRQALGWEKDTLGLCTVGSLIEIKGHRFLLEALGRLAGRLPDVRLVLVGDGDLRETLTRQADQAGLARHVTFVGYQPRPLDYMAASDVFVLPSLSEGMPLVVLEAMSMGLPVVSTRVGAVPDLIEDGKSGILVPPGEVDAIATAVERLGNAPLREKFGQEARQSVSLMGLESTTALLVSCYHRLVQGGSLN